MQAGGRYRLDAATAADNEPFVVYDATGGVDTVLTAFGRAVAAAGQPATARAYVYALASYFSFLDTDPAQQGVGRRWDAPPAEVRAAIAAYRAAHSGGAGVLLAALRRFYRMQFAVGSYPDPEPLVGLAGAPTAGQASAASDVVTDPLLHARILLTGHRLGWGLRER